jgi:hypothetical protein
MELPGKIETTEEVFSLLSQFYTEVTHGEIPDPGYMLTQVTKFPNGDKFEICQIPGKARIYVRVAENNGINMGFGLSTDGLSDISFSDDKRFRQISLEALKSEERIRFKLAAIDLTPWFLDRYKDEKRKPLPNGVASLFEQLLVPVSG